MPTMPVNKRRKDMSENPVKTRLFDLLQDLDRANGEVLKVKRGDNHGAVLGSIYVWQETKRHAEKALKASWSEAVSEGLVSDDDVLRESAVGEEWMLIESNGFSAVAKLDKPKQLFSRDKFIEKIAKTFHLDRSRLDTIANECCVESKPALSKRVIEA
jgi:hypothetical protein